jgi:hypothetical protein
MHFCRALEYSKTDALNFGSVSSFFDTIWVTDITYVRLAGGLWLYLCVVVDLYSGFVVGWSMSRCQNRQLVIQAVLMALWQRESRQPVILHSDRGCRFTSDEYQRFLKGHNLTCSMSGVGNCGDNAACEGFFGMLKRQRVNRRRYQTHAEGRADIFDYSYHFLLCSDHSPEVSSIPAEVHKSSRTEVSYCHWRAPKVCRRSRGRTSREMTFSVRSRGRVSGPQLVAVIPLEPPLRSQVN